MVIIGSKTGQLANRLFAFSHFIANSIEYKYNLYNPAFEEYREYFLSTLSGVGKHPIYLDLRVPVPVPLLQRITRIGSKLLPRSKFHRFLSCSGFNNHFDLNDVVFVADAQTKLVIVEGWKLRDEFNFQKHANAIRTFFIPTSGIRKNVKNLVKRCRENGDILVGVHIRKGDYKEWRGGIYYYDNKTYMEKMLELERIFKDEGKSVTFLICSNEPVSKDDFQNLSINTGSVPLVEDLYALSECDYIIGPPSTFSMWASFYGEVPLLHIKSSEQNIALHDFSVCKGSMPI